MSVKIHFLDMGAGDCTIVDFPKRTSGDDSYSARLMMIDINSCPDSGYTDAIKYFKSKFPNKSLFRFICTHPHKDHITGIDELFDGSGINISIFWDNKNDFYPEDWENDPSPEDWEMYEKIKKGKMQGITVLNYTSNSKPVNFWDQDRIEILSPSPELVKDAHTYADGSKRAGEEVELNNMSMSLLMKVNSKKIVFAADIENKGWEDVIKNKKSLISDIHILKASHHGRENGFYEEAVKIMNPKFIVFSNSENQDKKHGAESLYERAAPNAIILKTSVHGNLVAKVSYDKGTATEWTSNRDCQ